MKPMTPEERARVIEAHPAAAPGEIEADLDEYERLVARMFQRDPDAPDIAGVTEAVDTESARLAALHEKLFEQ
jgi:hypothetical protein